MKPKIDKTPEDWKKIRFENSLGPQIGGLLHDAVALAIAFYKDYKVENEEKMTVKEYIKIWLDTLYTIAEDKKEELTTPQPIDWKRAERASKAFAQGKTIKEIEEEEHEADKLNEAKDTLASEEEINANLQVESELAKEADNYPEQMSERSAEEHNK